MKYDLIIIGSGPAGYVAAIRAGQLGLKTAIIEKGEIGGMCLNWGCIPSKALIESAKLFKKIQKDAGRFGIDGIDKKAISFNFSKAVKRAGTIVTKLTKGVSFLLEKNGVEIITGEAEIISENSITVNNRNIEATNIIISTGSRMPKMETKHEGLVLDVKNLFKQQELPENIVVYGNNSTAIELAQFFALIGKKVTMAIPNKGIMLLADKYLADYMLGVLKKNKIKLIFDANLDSLDSKYSDGKLQINDTEVACDMILNAQDRTAVIPKSNITIETVDGFIKSDEDCKMPNAGMYAIGDVNGKSSFAHIASAQGLHVIDHIKGVKSKLDIKKQPLNMYTVPEVAQIGSTEAELKDQGVDYKVGEFSLNANGKALAEGTAEGFIRIISETKYGEVLGVQIVAANATDLISEASAYMQVESTVYDIASTVHAHPTIAEVFMEAGMDSLDQAIHK